MLKQIIVDIVALGAALFLAGSIYRSVSASRKSKQAACPGCGACEASKTDATGIARSAGSAVNEVQKTH